MLGKTRAIRKRQGGFTLIELMIAGAIMSVIGIGLTQGLRLADQTNDSVQDRTGHNRELRKALKHLRPELRAARTDTMTVTVNGEGNHVLTIQVPIASAGAPAWGVYDRTLGETPATQNRADWQLRYQVIADAFGDRILVRQILDTGGTVQQQHTMARRVLTSADPEGPGFTVQATGDVWEVRLVTKLEDSDGARTDTFHIRLRN